MKIIPASSVVFDTLCESLHAGSVIVYPTETCYGIGCDATNNQAVDRVFAIKQRPIEKSVLLVVDDVSRMVPYIMVTPLLAKLAKTYWPGPLTVVVPLMHQGNLAQGVIRHDGTIAFRVSSHPFVHNLCSMLQTPLVSTSANISSLPNPYTVHDVVSMFSSESEQPDSIIDGGTLSQTPPSTIVELLNDTVQVLRQGSIVIS